jgi:hypothetical protein
MQQHVYKNSPDHAVFARKIHREFGPILNRAREGIASRDRDSKRLISSTLTGSGARVRAILAHGASRSASQSACSSSGREDVGRVGQTGRVKPGRSWECRIRRARRTWLRRKRLGA